MTVFLEITPHLPSASLFLFSSQVWWLLFCSLRAAAQDSFFLSSSLCLRLSLGKPIHSCYSGYLLLPKGWTTAVFSVMLVIFTGISSNSVYSIKTNQNMKQFPEQQEFPQNLYALFTGEKAVVILVHISTMVTRSESRQVISLKVNSSRIGQQLQLMR